MQTLKQGMAAVVLIMSLGLVMPSAFGGSASADPVPFPGGRTEPPRWFYCDLNKDGTYDEEPFQVVSQANNRGSFHVLGSSTILSYSYDLIDELYVPFTEAELAAAGFLLTPIATEPEIIRADPTDPRQNGQGNKNGKFAQAVPCHENQVEPGDEFTSGTEDVVAEGAPLVKDAHYHVFYSRTWYVTVTGNDQGAIQAASVENGGAGTGHARGARAEQGTHKHGGKHHSKGKHRK